jgi:hypothetical protein
MVGNDPLWETKDFCGVGALLLFLYRELAFTKHFLCDRLCAKGFSISLY